MSELTGHIAHYEILGPLGAGGMGAVYRARDEQLGREVALKVLLAGTTDDAGARARLLREARTASQLNHPNVAHIYQVGEDDGQVWVAMELVDGRTLAASIPPGGMSPEPLLRIAQQIAEGLAHAHAHGVVHRDLKSANVMIDAGGRARILDFGLARRLPGSGGFDTTADLGLTDPGIVMGTPNHLPPEVLRGGTADTRSDVWALGVVLYEMASSRFPFEGRSMADLALAIVNEEPLPLGAHVPAGLPAVIARCLAKDPARRYADAGAVAAAIEVLRSGAIPPAAAARRRPRWALVAGAAAFVVVITAAFFAGGLRERLFGGGGEHPRIRSLAVLPLANLSGDPAQDYFADGMTEELITDLAPIPGLKVISRTSVMRFKGSTLALPEIARQLGVDAVVEGSVIRAGNRVRITAQLIHAATDHHLWAHAFERDFSEVLALQSEVARDIVQEIRLQISPHVSERLANPRVVNAEAYDLYLKGRYEWNKSTAESMRKAIAFFEAAQKLDPGDARALSGLADAWLLSMQFAGGDSAAASMEKVKAYAQRALTADEGSAEAHASYAAALLFGEWDWRGALAHAERSLELNPGYATAHLIHSVVLSAAGRIDEAVAANQRALELDPFSPINLGHGILVLRASHHEKEALELALRGLALHPESLLIQDQTARVYEQMGRYEDAIALVAKMAPEAGAAMAPALRRGFATAGPAGYWKAAVEFTRRLGPGTSGALAFMNAKLGDHAAALDALERSYAEHSSDMLFLNVEPAFDGLHGEPRFQALVERIGLR